MIPGRITGAKSRGSTPAEALENLLRLLEAKGAHLDGLNQWAEFRIEPLQTTIGGEVKQWGAEWEER